MQESLCCTQRALRSPEATRSSCIRLDATLIPTLTERWASGLGQSRVVRLVEASLSVGFIMSSGIHELKFDTVVSNAAAMSRRR